MKIIKITYYNNNILSEISQSKVCVQTLSLFHSDRETVFESPFAQRYPPK